MTEKASYSREKKYLHIRMLMELAVSVARLHLGLVCHRERSRSFCIQLVAKSISSSISRVLGNAINEPAIPG
jgi:hypothetical protein